MSFDVEAIRAQFPILSRRVNGKPLIYFDNAATTQKPRAVVDAIVDYYYTCNANVHRGAHQLADEATRRFEQARDTVARFISANKCDEVIWTKGTTEAINIVAHGLTHKLQGGDQVLVTEMEHHANLVTWQQACKASGADLVVAPITDSGEIIVEKFKNLLNEKTRLAAFPHVSNVLGTMNPIGELTQWAKSAGALVLVDGAQGVAHEKVNVAELGCDFYTFSAHKLFGPTGIGVLWGREAVLSEWPVWQTGGEMIETVTYQDAKWNVLPYRFEAGTPNIAGAIGMAAAIEWFTKLDFQGIQDHEHQLMVNATEKIIDIPGLKIIGNAERKVATLSFTLEAGHPADIGYLLDQQGIAVRTGHHCAEPLMQRLGLSGTARASFSIYNTLDEVDTFATALRKANTMLN